MKLEAAPSATLSRTRADIAHHFHAIAAISRDDFFGAREAFLRPLHLLEDSATMFAGYVGKDYVVGQGLLLVAINPGGGGDAYVRRIPEDEILYPRLVAFKYAKPEEVLLRFEEVNNTISHVVASWNLWRILGPTLEAARMQLSEVAYINVVPYRTRGDKMPPAAARSTGWHRVIRPTFELLKPRAVVALGKKAGSIVEPFVPAHYMTFCVPRTIGDRRISEQARAVHARISAALAK